MMEMNSSVGMVALNTNADAVLMKAASIQPSRRRTTPRKSIAKTGAVTFRVWRTRDMPGPGIEPNPAC